jgi:hypothetical protein
MEAVIAISVVTVMVIAVFAHLHMYSISTKKHR